MATDSARSTAPPAARQLWQVPVFLLGVSALIAVPLLRPYWKSDRAAAEWQLRAARQALEQSPADPTRALQQGQRVLDSVDHFPDLAAAAHFVVGSAHLRLADDPAADGARERQQAREHLELAQTGVAEDDRPKLQYRLGKVWSRLGVDPVQVVAALKESVESADDLAEGYSLLAEAYLHLNPPDQAKALDATKRQLDRAQLVNDLRAQAQARLRLGELYLGQQKAKEARQFLVRIPNDGTGPYFAAQALLAQSYEDTREWEQATRCWEQVRQDPRSASSDKGRLLYHLGYCYAQEQRPKEAAGVWEEARRLSGDEAQAAALRLAELKLDAEAPSAAVEALTAALRTVGAPSDYHNPFVTMEEMQQLVNRATELCCSKGEWETARAAAEIYGRLTPPSGGDVMAGKTADKWAEALVEKAKQAPPDQAVVLEDQLRALRRDAGLAYERAADKAAPGPQQANWLDNSASRLLLARDYAHAAAVLSRFVQLEGVVPAGDLARGWLHLARTQHFLQQNAAARDAYQHCLKLGGPLVANARLGLAQLDMLDKHFDDAERALEENKKLFLESSQADPALQEETTFALAEVAFQRAESVKEELREYGTATERLRAALTQYPDGAPSLRAMILLARCYWNEAFIRDGLSDPLRNGGVKLSSEEKERYDRQYRDFLSKSVEQYDRIEQRLLARQSAGGRLSDEETAYLKMASLTGAQAVLLYMHKVDEAERRYGALALRYKGMPEELLARSQLWQCYYHHLKKPDLAREQVRQIREALDAISDAAFEQSPGVPKRVYWADWLAQAAKASEPAK